MKRKLLSVILVSVMLFVALLPAHAAEIENAETGVMSENAIVAADYAEVGSELEPEETLPASYSSAALGYVTTARNQRFNTCWAYSSVASLETSLSMKGYSSTYLSPMHMNYWGCTQSDGSGWQRSYNDAGYPYIAIGYLTSFGSLTEEQFDENKSQQDYDALKDTLAPYQCANSIIYLNGKDIDTIKTAIYQYGAAVGNFHYNAAYITTDNESYYCNIEGLATSQLNGHAVELVGWNDNYMKENFSGANTRPSKNGAWLCKNSWGPSYGDNGYFWISYEDNYLFDKRFGPSYAIGETTAMKDNIKIQQNERYGATYEFQYAQSYKSRLDRMTYVNVLDFSNGYHKIDKVVFESTAEGSEYTVYYIPVDSNGVPTADTSTWILLAQGTIDYQGYICAKTYGFDAPVGKGAVGVQIKKKTSDGSISIGVNEWLRAGGRMLIVPESQYGQSYLIGYESEPLDVMSFYLDKLSDDIGGTFVIKAVCRNDSYIIGDVDDDKEVTMIDATILQRYCSYMDVDVDEEQLMHGDIDGNGELEVIDATFIQRYLAYIPIPYPIG